MSRSAKEDDMLTVKMPGVPLSCDISVVNHPPHGSPTAKIVLRLIDAKGRGHRVENRSRGPLIEEPESKFLTTSLSQAKDKGHRVENESRSPQTEEPEKKFLMITSMS